MARNGESAPFGGDTIEDQDKPPGTALVVPQYSAQHYTEAELAAMKPERRARLAARDEAIRERQAEAARKAAVAHAKLAAREGAKRLQRAETEAARAKAQYDKLARSVALRNARAKEAAARAEQARAKREASLAARMEALKARAEARATPRPDRPSAGGEALEAFINTQEATASARRPIVPPRATQPSLPRLWWALWALSFKRDLRSDPLGLLWWFAEPTLIVLVVTFAALVFQGEYIYDMPTFPFAVLGVITWMTFRMTFMTTAGGVSSMVLSLHEPSVSRFDVMTARAPKSLLGNLFVGTVFLGYLIVFDDLRFAENFPAVLFLFIVAGISGLACGLVAHSISFVYPGTRKLYIIFLRAGGLTSGLFYVSEQMPDPFRSLLLWNPMIHANQLVRQEWFRTYQSQDASVSFLATFVLGIVLVAVAFATMERRLRARRGEAD